MRVTRTRPAISNRRHVPHLALHEPRTRERSTSPRPTRKPGARAREGCAWSCRRNKSKTIATIPRATANSTAIATPMPMPAARFTRRNHANHRAGPGRALPSLPFVIFVLFVVKTKPGGYGFDCDCDPDADCDTGRTLHPPQPCQPLRRLTSSSSSSSSSAALPRLFSSLLRLCAKACLHAFASSQKRTILRKAAERPPRRISAGNQHNAVESRHKSTPVNGKIFSRL